MKTRSKLVSLVVVISLILIVLFLERFSFPKSELLVDNSEQVNSEIEGFLAGSRECSRHVTSEKPFSVTIC